MHLREVWYLSSGVRSYSPVEDFVPILPTTRCSTCTVQNCCISPKPAVNIAQVTAAVVTTAATTGAATTLAATTENALTDVTTLTTMADRACTESASKSVFTLSANSTYNSASVTLRRLRLRCFRACQSTASPRLGVRSLRDQRLAHWRGLLTTRSTGPVQRDWKG